MGGRPGYPDERPHGRYAGRPSGGYQNGPSGILLNFASTLLIFTILAWI